MYLKEATATEFTVNRVNILCVHIGPIQVNKLVQYGFKTTVGDPQYLQCKSKSLVLLAQRQLWQMPKNKMYQKQLLELVLWLPKQQMYVTTLNVTFILYLSTATRHEVNIHMTHIGRYRGETVKSYRINSILYLISFLSYSMFICHCETLVSNYIPVGFTLLILNGHRQTKAKN